MQAAPLLPPNAGPKSRPNCSTAFSQAVAMQRMLLADALSPKTPARERAQVARAWKDLEEQKRILRMKPAPKAVDANEYKERQKKRKKVDEPAFVETGAP